MCHWLAYSGSPVQLDHLLLRPRGSLIAHRPPARPGVAPTDGDGFGIGWYGPAQVTPALFRSTASAWRDRNLRELAAQTTAGRVFAHVRGATSTPVQQTDCHPFRHGRWLWMSSGGIGGFPVLKRDLAMSVESSLFPEIEGSTDAELLFLLAVTLGLTEDPPTGVARAVGLVEELARLHRIEDPVRMTAATTDGETTWAFRYSSGGVSPSLLRSADVATLRAQLSDRPTLPELAPDTRLVVSEPVDDLRGTWCEVPESSYVVVAGATADQQGFAPASP